MSTPIRCIYHTNKTQININYFYDQVTKCKDDTIQMVDPKDTTKKIFVENYYFELHCSKIRSNIQEILFPKCIINYNNYRKRITNGEYLKYIN